MRSRRGQLRRISAPTQMLLTASLPASISGLRAPAATRPNPQRAGLARGGTHRRCASPGSNHAPARWQRSSNHCRRSSAPAVQGDGGCGRNAARSGNRTAGTRVARGTHRVRQACAAAPDTSPHHAKVPPPPRNKPPPVPPAGRPIAAPPLSIGLTFQDGDDDVGIHQVCHVHAGEAPGGGSSGSANVTSAQLPVRRSK